MAQIKDGTKPIKNQRGKNPRRTPQRQGTTVTAIPKNSDYTKDPPGDLLSIIDLSSI